VVAFAVACLAVAAAPAEAAAAAAPSTQDSDYLRAAHQAHLAEIAAGGLAARKGGSARLRELGERLVTDHTRLDRELGEVSTALALELPDGPTADQRALAVELEGASGLDFDSLFVSTQMDAHAKALSLGEKELADGSDPAVKQVARNAAPVIRAHHQALMDVGRGAGVPVEVDTGSGGLVAPRSYQPWVVGLAAVGLLALTASWLLRRRGRVGR